VLLGELGIALGHLDIGMPEQFGKLIEISAAHHVPGREGVPLMPLAA
jgi:hypothetical protein